MTRSYDVVIHGASGFTGRLCAEYLSQRVPDGERLRWAMSGRSPDKLASVRDAIGAPADTPLVVADADDAASLAALAESTRLVLSTVGPYQQYGSGLVAACAQAGTDYVDLCGEPAWMRRMIDAHEATARASGARIVFSCGFDSIPFDLGVLRLEDEAILRFGEPATRVRGLVRAMKGTFSGGTAASLRATLHAAAADPGVLALLKDPFALTPGFAGPEQPRGNRPVYDEALGTWLAPFVMAAINTRNVHRTNFLLGHRYGTGFVYDEMIVAGDGERGQAMAHRIAQDRSLESGDGPKPGEGPSQAERDAGFYELRFLGETAGGGMLTVGVRGERDPGYGSTSRMIVEAAACLLRDATDTAGGIWTPGAAMGRALMARLQQHDVMRFTVDPD